MSRNIGGPAIALFAQLLIVVVLACYIYFSDTPFLPEGGKYIVPTLLASLFLAAGILTLYMAIERGQVSVVMPVFSLNVVITAILAILILEETVTTEKISGLFLAILAIVLLRKG
jgi:transporter family protein